MFANRPEPDALAPGRLLREPAAVIFQPEFDHWSVCHERHGKTSGAGMPQHIGDTLLRASVDRNPGGVGRFDRELPNVDFHRETVRQAARLNQMAQGIFYCKTLPVGRMELMRDGPDLIQSLVGEGLQSRQRVAARLRQNGSASSEYFQI